MIDETEDNEFAGKNPSILENTLKHDRVILLLGLLILTVLAWIYIIHLAWGMNYMDMDMNMTMPMLQSWGFTELFLLFSMWAIMMVAMMVPSATPMILLYASTIRRRNENTNIMMLTCLFVLGYLAVWTGFSLLATLTQWGLHTVALLSSMMVSTSPLLGGILLVVAGIFQWTPLKHACLRHCRSPLGFLMTEWREGKGGAFIMGLKHGMYCVGCCWLLMVLLFVTGVMNLLWIAVIAIFILVEKLVPAGDWVARLAGILLIGYGMWMINGVFHILNVSN